MAAAADSTREALLSEQQRSEQKHSAPPTMPVHGDHVAIPVSAQEDEKEDRLLYPPPHKYTKMKFAFGAVITLLATSLALELVYFLFQYWGTFNGAKSTEDSFSSSINPGEKANAALSLILSALDLFNSLFAVSLISEARGIKFIQFGVEKPMEQRIQDRVKKSLDDTQSYARRASKEALQLTQEADALLETLGGQLQKQPKVKTPAVSSTITIPHSFLKFFVPIFSSFFNVASWFGFGLGASADAIPFIGDVKGLPQGEMFGGSWLVDLINSISPEAKIGISVFVTLIGLTYYFMLSYGDSNKAEKKLLEESAYDKKQRGPSVDSGYQNFASLIQRGASFVYIMYSVLVGMTNQTRLIAGNKNLIVGTEAEALFTGDNPLLRNFSFISLFVGGLGGVINHLGTRYFYNVDKNIGTQVQRDLNLLDDDASARARGISKAAVKQTEIQMYPQPQQSDAVAGAQYNVGRSVRAETSDAIIVKSYTTRAREFLREHPEKQGFFKPDGNGGMNDNLYFTVPNFLSALNRAALLGALSFIPAALVPQLTVGVWVGCGLLAAVTGSLAFYAYLRVQREIQINTLARAIFALDKANEQKINLELLTQTSDARRLEAEKKWEQAAVIREKTFEAKVAPLYAEARQIRETMQRPDAGPPNDKYQAVVKKLVAAYTADDQDEIDKAIKALNKLEELITGRKTEGVEETKCERLLNWCYPSTRGDRQPLVAGSDIDWDKFKADTIQAAKLDAQGNQLCAKYNDLIAEIGSLEGQAKAAGIIPGHSNSFSDYLAMTLNLGAQAARFLSSNQFIFGVAFASVSAGNPLLATLCMVIACSISVEISRNNFNYMEPKVSAAIKGIKEKREGGYLLAPTPNEPAVVRFAAPAA